MLRGDGAHGHAGWNPIRVVIPGLIIILLAALFLVVFAGYKRDIRRARERTLEGSHVLQTSRVLIEYGIVGEGAPLLVAHGAGGGCDQGLDFAEGLVRDGFKLIAVSRFGYLRSPLPPDASPQAQADAYAALLDALQVQRVVVVGLPAGAPSAMQFALRYAERTAALVLLVPAAYPPQVEKRSGGAAPKQVSGLAKILFDAAFKSDFLFWAMPRLAPRAMMRSLVGTPPAVVAAADDLFGTWEPAQFSAEHIPVARFIGYPSGGHLLIGHMRDLLFEIASFLRTHEEKRG